MMRAILLATLLLFWAFVCLWLAVEPAFAQTEGFVFDRTVSISAILAFFTIVFTWFRTRKSSVEKRDQEVNKRFTEIEGRLNEGARRMDRMDARLSATETKITDLPDRENFHSLELSMERMAGNFAVLSTKIESGAEFMTRVDKVLARQEEYLLTKSDDKK